MATLPVIANVYRVALSWINSSTGAGTAANIFHVRNATGFPNSPAVFSTLDAHAAIGMWGAVSTTYRVSQITITPLDGITASDQVTVPAVAKWTGNNSGDAIPNMANLIKLRTAKRGRSYRGRLYLPMVSETVQVNGTISSGAVTSIDTAWNTFITAIGTDATFPLTMGIASYKLASFEPILGAVCEGVGATQRRRLSRLR